MDGVVHVIDMLGATIKDLQAQLAQERARNEILMKALQEQAPKLPEPKQEVAQ